MKIELIDYLFRLDNSLYRLNSYSIGLAALFEEQIELIVDNSDDFVTGASEIASNELVRDDTKLSRCQYSEKSVDDKIKDQNCDAQFSSSVSGW